MGKCIALYPHDAVQHSPAGKPDSCSEAPMAAHSVRAYKEKLAQGKNRSGRRQRTKRGNAGAGSVVPAEKGHCIENTGVSVIVRGLTRRAYSDNFIFEKTDCVAP